MVTNRSVNGLEGLLKRSSNTKALQTLLLLLVPTHLLPPHPHIPRNFIIISIFLEET